MARYIINDGDSQYSVTFDLKVGYLSDGDGDIETYLYVSTTLPLEGGGSQEKFVVKTLNDVPDGYSAATSLTDLVSIYIRYYMANSIESSSSSSSS
jgi:hypothetical protein